MMLESSPTVRFKARIVVRLRHLSTPNASRYRLANPLTP